MVADFIILLDVCQLVLLTSYLYSIFHMLTRLVRLKTIIIYQPPFMTKVYKPTKGATYLQ